MVVKIFPWRYLAESKGDLTDRLLIQLQPEGLGDRYGPKWWSM